MHVRKSCLENFRCLLKVVHLQCFLFVCGWLYEYLTLGQEDNPGELIFFVNLKFTLVKYLDAWKTYLARINFWVENPQIPPPPRWRQDATLRSCAPFQKSWFRPCAYLQPSTRYPKESGCTHARHLSKIDNGSNYQELVSHPMPVC